MRFVRIARSNMPNTFQYVHVTGTNMATTRVVRVSRVIFNNAPAHTSAVVVAKLMELGFQLVSHPPYSPDLAPSDYYLFPNMKKWLAGKRFYGNEDVIAEINPPRLPRFK